ncbi:MAG: hypothetical protein MUF65_02975 [Rubritepida sp.]|jgi:hypothetical protein|nr:hypothetical protein [Rubritepida sp.]MCU0944317.1 hypothetical protein [Rubritepida sp.]
MNTLFYLTMLLAVFWLCVWCAMPEDMRARIWSPFDMREGEPRPKGEEPPAASRGPAAPGWRTRATRVAEAPRPGPAAGARRRSDAPGPRRRG